MADILYQSLLISAVAVVLLHILRLSLQPKVRNPPGPWKLRVIGSMHHLVNVLPHRALRALASIHGPLMMLQLGETPLVVVSSREMAREVLRTHDANFATRPRLLTGELLVYGCSIINLPLPHVQTRSHVENIHAAGPSTQVDVTMTFFELTSSIVSRASFGNKHRNVQEFLSAIKSGGALAGGFKIPDLFPTWRSVLAMVTDMRRTLEDVHRTLDSTLEEVIQERQGVRDRVGSSSWASAVEENLVDVLMGLQEKGGIGFHLNRNNIKGVILDLFVAGTGTLTSSLDWGMSELVRNPRVMDKLQCKIREAFRGKAAISEGDIEARDLPHLKLVVKENIRLHPSVPLLVPRESVDPCQVNGYMIPAGSRVVVNVWAIGRDPRYWEDVEEFKPERFEDSSLDFMGSNYEFLPFGSGRRMCPGISYGLAVLQMAFVQLCYHFNWSLPEGISEVDMTEGGGLGLRRKSPLRLCATPFIPESMSAV
ncbi:hypothetical protein VPH35_107570 [Triticum aestivum]